MASFGRESLLFYDFLPHRCKAHGIFLRVLTGTISGGWFFACARLLATNAMSTTKELNTNCNHRVAHYLLVLPCVLEF